MVPIYLSISHTLPKSRVFGLYFCRREYGSNFNRFDVVGPEAADFGEITQNSRIAAISSFKVIEGHRFSFQRKARMGLPISE